MTRWPSKRPAARKRNRHTLKGKTDFAADVANERKAKKRRNRALRESGATIYEGPTTPIEKRREQLEQRQRAIEAQRREQ